MPKKTYKKSKQKNRSSRLPRLVLLVVLIGAVMLSILFLVWQGNSLPVPSFLQTPVPPTPTVNPAYIGVEGLPETPEVL